MCPIVWIYAPESMEEWLEWFNVAEVDLLTDLLIVDGLSQ